MTTSSDRRIGPLSRPTFQRFGRFGVFLVGTFLLLLAPLASAVPTATTWSDPPQSWSNGIVLCEFAASVPTVAVSALDRMGTGLSATIGSISEVEPTGVVAASANLSSATWTAANFSTDDAYDLGYTVLAPVMSPSVPAQVLGSVDARVDFVLPVYASSPSVSTDTVAVDLLVSDWPWHAVQDHLVVTLAAWPSFTGEEHLVLGTSAGSLLSSVSNPAGEPFEQLAGSTMAVANPGSTTPVNISATASVAGNSSGALVSVALGDTAGEFSTVSYSASVQVLFPKSIVGIPTVDFVAVGGTAALVALLVAAGVHRLRRRPSDLTYAEENEP